MPLSEHEQRILEDIERRLREDDSQFVERVSRTSLQAHVARRIRLAVFGFGLGFLMLMLFAMSVWIALFGFALMLTTGLLVYQYLKGMGREQIQTWKRGSGRFSVTGFLARLAERFRGSSGGAGGASGGESGPSDS